MRRLSSRAFLPIAGAVLILSSGCIESQMRTMTVPESKKPSEILKAAESVLRERYYQVRVYPSSYHIVTLTPIWIDGNYPMRKKIDVQVFLENGYYMPKVWVRRYIDIAEPETERGPIAARFPVEVNGHPRPSDNWWPLQYDRSEEEEILNAILERLNIPS